MNNQVKLIDADKILWELALQGFMTDDIKRKIDAGEFDPDTPPVPTIKPGDKVRHKRLGESIVRVVVNDDVAEVAIGMVCYYVEIRDLEGVE